MKGSEMTQVLLFAALFVLLPVAQGKIVTYYWTIAHSWQSPDYVEKLIIAIIGQYPGPDISATVDDTVVVNIYNTMLSEGVTIHCHGIHQVLCICIDDTGISEV
jgi:FtsP/CotA-like multicopper oxidase with cupredoxin domain